MSQFLISPLISLYSTSSQVTLCCCFAFTLNSTFQNTLLSLCITNSENVCVFDINVWSLRQLPGLLVMMMTLLIIMTLLLLLLLLQLLLLLPPAIYLVPSILLSDS